MQDDLGYQQRIALENNVTPEPALEDLHALSAPALDGPTAEERRAARDDRARGTCPHPRRAGEPEIGPSPEFEIPNSHAPEPADAIARKARTDRARPSSPS